MVSVIWETQNRMIYKIEDATKQEKTDVKKQGGKICKDVKVTWGRRKKCVGKA